MRIKPLLILAVTLFSVIFASCSDDLNTIGDNIRPDEDDIIVGIDTVTLTARTVSMEDSVYARTSYPLLGEYSDPVFGKVKTDYMSELFCPANTKFKDNVISIDSVLVRLACYGFTGDSISPMGLSIYEVNKPLVANFFTNVDPKKYVDMSKPLGQNVFSLDASPRINGMRWIITDLDMSVGQRFYNEWKTKPSTFSSPDKFLEFFKGIYITTTFGSTRIMNMAHTFLEIHYTYRVNVDSTSVDYLRFPVTQEVIQLNRVQNTIPDNLFTNSDTRSYLKTPAGVYTEITIPLKEIIEKTKVGEIINSASFKIKGFSEEEEKSTFKRPTDLLFINKDSLPNFFLKNNKNNSRTSFIVTRNQSNNTYDFGNIGYAINYYADYYRNAQTIPDLKYLAIPVDVRRVKNTSTGSLDIDAVYNLMNPTSAIFRTDEKNMKMGLLFSTYRKNK